MKRGNGMDQPTFVKLLKKESAKATFVHRSLMGCGGLWWVIDDGYLRTRDDQCPITFVANCCDPFGRRKKYSTANWKQAARSLDMSEHLARAIAITADGGNGNPEFNESLRGELIDACQAMSTIKPTKEVQDGN